MDPCSDWKDYNWNLPTAIISVISALKWSFIHQSTRCLKEYSRIKSKQYLILKPIIQGYFLYFSMIRMHFIVMECFFLSLEIMHEITEWKTLFWAIYSLSNIISLAKGPLLWDLTLGILQVYRVSKRKNRRLNSSSEGALYSKFYFQFKV